MKKRIEHPETEMAKARRVILVSKTQPSAIFETQDDDGQGDHIDSQQVAIGDAFRLQIALRWAGTLSELADLIDSNVSRL